MHSQAPEYGTHVRLDLSVPFLRGDGIKSALQASSLLKMEVVATTHSENHMLMSKSRTRPAAIPWRAWHPCPAPVPSGPSPRLVHSVVSAACRPAHWSSPLAPAHRHRVARVGHSRRDGTTPPQHALAAPCPGPLDQPLTSQPTGVPTPRRQHVPLATRAPRCRAHSPLPSCGPRWPRPGRSTSHAPSTRTPSAAPPRARRSGGHVRSGLPTLAAPCTARVG